MILLASTRAACGRAIQTRLAAMSDPGGLQALALQAGTVLSRHVTAGYAAGAVALIGRGTAAEVVVIGQQGLDSPVPMRRDSVFRIASLTKPLTAAAAMMLVQHGKLRLADPVVRWLPELANRRVLRQLDSALTDTVPARRPITVEDLLTFRCGLGIVLEPPGTYPIQREIAALQLIGFGPPDPAYPTGPDEWLKRLGRLPLMAQPGERWIYNTGSYILGVLLARASGRSLPELLRELLFEPLGMRDTAFAVAAASRARLVDAYRLEAGRLRLSDAAAASAWSTPPRFPDGGAGLVSTVDDFFAFSRLLLHQLGGSERLLSPASIAAMTTDHLTEDQRAGGPPVLSAGRGWGFGMSVVAMSSVEGLPQGAFGWNGGLGTTWVADPRSGITAILFTQTQFTSPVAPAMHQEFWRAIFSPPVS
jgi:CubicO group peptidase (beta-lactamase class C family)